MRNAYIRRVSLMKRTIATTPSGFRRNLALAKHLWSGQIYREQRHALRLWSENYGLSVAAGDLQLLETRWYVTHTGLIRLAQRRRCSGIIVNLMTELCDSVSSRWVFRATVYTSAAPRGFVGY